MDNNAIRDAVSKATSRSLEVLVLLSELHRLWAQAQCLCWVSRVPTKSNVGDYPSRQLPQESAKIINGVHLPDLLPSEALCAMVCNAASFIDHMRAVLAKRHVADDGKKG